MKHMAVGSSWQTALVVAAHPDDMEFFCGGTVRVFAESGIRVVACIATCGDKGSLDINADGRALGLVRKAEAAAAAESLGVEGLIFLDGKDGELASYSGLTAEITRVYRQVKPDVVITFDPWRRYELHPDHRAIGFAAVDARLAARLPLFYPELIDEGLMPWSIRDLLLFSTETPDYYVDVTRTIQAKVHALSLHASQTVSGWEGMIKAVNDEARACGRTSGVEFAEAFKRIHVPSVTVLGTLGATGEARS